MSYIDFHCFVKKVCEALESISKADPHRIAACKSGEDFEACVVEAVNTVLSESGIAAAVHYTPGGHSFPDIVIEFPAGEKYGIEVKSSSSSTSKGWKINGNSVLGSTKEDVIETYIIFGKTAMAHQAFRYKKYEDAVANVGVTHSPRYLIDMDVDPAETFFAKSGLSYREISESDNPIGLITGYFRSQGHQAWWLGADHVAPAIIRMFSDLPVNERNALIGYCFAHFPEVFSSNANKFSRCAMWLVTEHSVVSSSLRDNFSAGGKFEFSRYGRISRIFDILIECKQYVIDALNDADIEELCDDWGLDYDPEYRTLDKVEMWIITAAVKCSPISCGRYRPREILSQIMRQE